jgi:Co/Zn/Cd efflux system component
MIVEPSVIQRLAQRYGGSARAADDSSTALSGNGKSLLVMFILFSTITATQYYAAILAHSVALKADCASMAVDAVSYLGNMVAECTSHKRCRAILELIMSAASLMLLGYFTRAFFLEAAASVGLLRSSSSEAGEEDVDAMIVLSFAALGILFDVLSLASYKAWHADPSGRPGAATAASPSINMLSALLHVLSDLARVRQALPHHTQRMRPRPG